MGFTLTTHVIWALDLQPIHERVSPLTPFKIPITTAFLSKLLK